MTQRVALPPSPLPSASGGNVRSETNGVAEEVEQRPATRYRQRNSITDRFLHKFDEKPKDMPSTDQLLDLAAVGVTVQAGSAWRPVVEVSKRLGPQACVPGTFLARDSDVLLFRTPLGLSLLLLPSVVHVVGKGNDGWNVGEKVLEAR